MTESSFLSQRRSHVRKKVKTSRLKLCWSRGLLKGISIIGMHWGGANLNFFSEKWETWSWRQLHFCSRCQLCINSPKQIRVEMCPRCQIWFCIRKNELANTFSVSCYRAGPLDERKAQAAFCKEAAQVDKTKLDSEHGEGGGFPEKKKEAPVAGTHSRGTHWSSCWNPSKFLLKFIYKSGRVIELTTRVPVVIQLNWIWAQLK